ncbi:MAG: [LysW]-aminoadipate kinase [Anaerolineales bacterium]|jgi:acetylglutamate/LysW-gamma-L-alpha-aminoadipate kinase
MIGNEPAADLVVKLGGTRGVEWEAACEDLAAVIHQGTRVIVVHGGSAETNRMAEALGHPPRFVTSPSGYVSRFTDRETLEIFAMVTAGRLSSILVEALQKRGVNALGLSGADGRLIVAQRKEAVRSLQEGKVLLLHGDHTGTIREVDGDLLRRLLQAGYTPVIAPLAISPQGELLNVDADRAAAAVASNLGVKTLILLTAAPGLLHRFPDESTLLSFLPRAQLPEALEFAQGGMKKKILGASEALQGGVARVILGDGRVDHPITYALSGGGTSIT